MLTAAASLAATAAAAGAQTAGAPRLEAAFGGGWLGGVSFGAADASLRTRTGDDYLLFETESRLASAPIVEARASVALTNRYTAEARFGFARPDARTSITGDVEGAPDLEVAEQIAQYTFEGALVVLFGEARAGSLRPFLSAGAGYLRQLHEGQTLVENGVVYHLGGGVRQSFFTRQQGAVKAVGIRGDARLNLRSGGVSLGDGALASLSLLGGVFVAF